MSKNRVIKHKEKQISKGGNGFIRLISGKWRGKKLKVGNKEGLRPTTDRAKETLFNWLMHDIRDANCLDCFAGSGSLSFEALSRYASNVTLLELDRETANQLKENLNELKVNNASVIETDSLKYLKEQATQEYDLVFIDPPFHNELVSDCCKFLEQNNYLKPNALIYIEKEVQLTDIELPINWKLLKEKSAGQVCFQLFVRE